MTDYETKEEAEEHLPEQTRKPVGFCPLRNTDCNPDCICYVNAHVRTYNLYSPTRQVWRVAPSYCDNRMFFGE